MKTEANPLDELKDKHKLSLNFRRIEKLITQPRRVFVEKVLTVAETITNLGFQTQTVKSFLENVNSLFTVPYLQEQASSSGAASITSAVYIPFYLPFFAIIFSTIIGSSSGLYPALKAQSLPPVIALK